MPTDSPGAQDVHVDMLLSNMAIGYKNSLYIAEQVFPKVLVTRQSNIVPKFDRSHWFRRRAKETGEREAPPVSGYTVDVTDTYYCRELSAAHFISDSRRANTDAPFDADRNGLEWVMDGMALEKEYRFVNDFWKTGVWSTDKTGGGDFTKWDTYATSTPIQNIREFRRIVRRLIGISPNKLVLGDLAYDVLCDHPNMLDRVKYSGSSERPAMINAMAMAEILDIDEVLVGEASYTTSPEGTAEASVTLTPMFDDDALLIYVPASPSIFTPAAGYTFDWQTLYGGGVYVKRRRDPSDKGDLIEAFEHYDMKATATSAGLFMSDATD